MNSFAASQPTLSAMSSPLGSGCISGMKNFLISVVTLGATASLLAAGVSDSDSLALIPVDSTLMLEETIIIPPKTKYVTFTNGEQKEQGDSSCYFTIPESPKLREVKPKTRAVSVMKADNNSLELDSKLFLSLRCFSKTSPTIGDLRKHLGKFFTLEISPPVVVEPVFLQNDIPEIVSDEDELRVIFPPVVVEPL